MPRAAAPAHIDRLLAAYEADLKSSPRRFFRQNTNRYEANSVDRHGHVTNAFLDPHNFESLPPIRDAIFALLSKAHGEHFYFTNQPEYSLLNDLKSGLKIAIDDNPMLMRGARWRQRRSSSQARAAP